MTNDPWKLLQTLPADHPDRMRARNQLVEQNMGLVHMLARRYANRGEPTADLIQVGAIGLIKSVERFDPARGCTFPTFATPTILGELKRHFRDRTWMVRAPRRLQELQPALNRARDELAQTLQRSPTVAELAAHLDATEEEVIEAFEASGAYSAETLDAPSDTDSPMTSVIGARLGITDPGIDLVERRQTAIPLLDALPERQRRIIFLRYFKDLTQTEIADQLGISQMHVSRLLNRAIETLNAGVMDNQQHVA